MGSARVRLLLCQFQRWQGLRRDARTDRTDSPKDGQAVGHLPHGLRGAVPADHRLCARDARPLPQRGRHLPRMCSLHGHHLHLDVSVVLATLGNHQARHLGKTHAGGSYDRRAVPLLECRPMGLRLPRPLRTMAQRAQRAHRLFGRHPHTGEPEPLAHHPCRAREPQELPGARLHHRHGRLRGRLSHLRLDGGGRLDCQRPQPMALQPALRHDVPRRCAAVEDACRLAIPQ